MTCCDYARQLWAELLTPEWMATTGLPLLLTLVGLVLAYIFLARQLRSDRQLRAADRQVAAASTLGRRIGEDTRAIFDLAYNDPAWLAPNSPLDLWPAVTEAEIHLPSHVEYLEEVSALTRDISRGWSWMSLLRPEGGAPTTPGHAHAAYRVLEPYLLALEEMGSDLRAWDGLAPLEVNPARRVDHVPVGAGRINPERKAWLTRVEAAYRARIDAQTGPVKAP